VGAADILGGRRVSIRIDTTTLSFFDPETRQLLRTRPNPLTPDEVSRLRGLRRAGPPPTASPEPVRVQRQVSDTGTITVARQIVALGRTHAGKTVTIDVTDTGHRLRRRHPHRPTHDHAAHPESQSQSPPPGRPNEIRPNAKQ
jgi:hypothetical protein